MYRVVTDASFAAGEAGLAAVLFDVEGCEVATLSSRIEAKSNVEAECRAARLGLELALHHGVREVEFLSDCSAAIHYVTSRDQLGCWAAKRFDRVTVRQVPRAEVAVADRLAGWARKGLEPQPWKPPKPKRPCCLRCKKKLASPEAREETGGYCGACVEWFGKWESMV